MKHLICCVLIISTLLCCAGCTANDADTINFYYIRDTYIYGQEDGVMVAEARDTSNFGSDNAIMSVYLAGPQDATLHSPFPAGTVLLEFSIEKEILHITLSSHVVTLSKAEQVLACACFARTAMELTGVNAVRFETDSSHFAKMDPIVIDRDSVLLYDDYHSAAPTE